MDSAKEADVAFQQALLEDDAAVLYDRAPCGYLTTDSNGLILKANYTFLAMAGDPHGHLVGTRRFADLLSVGGRIYYDTHYAPMLQMHGSAREIALELVRPDGTRLPVLVTSVVEPGAGARPSVIRAAVFDASDRRRYEQELLLATRRAERSEAQARDLAATLQASLIPPVAPHVPGLDIATAYQPAGKSELIGGDFFDIFPAGPEDWIVTLGDVSGKGVPAAIVTALVRHTLRAVTILNSDPAQALAALNDVLIQDPTDRFCTLVILRLRQQGVGWSVSIALGGHPLPLLCRPEQPPITVGQPGTLVGVLPDARFHTTHLTLEPGESLLLYTDGVTEARHDDTFYGEQRLHDLIRAEHSVGTSDDSPADLVDAILQSVLNFQSGDPSDDIAIITMCVSQPTDT